MHQLASGLWNGKPTANPCEDGEMWECPDLFALDGGHVLIYSALGKVFWQSGLLDESTMKFKRLKTGLLDLDVFYAEFCGDGFRSEEPKPRCEKPAGRP